MNPEALQKVITDLANENLSLRMRNAQLETEREARESNQAE